MVEVRCASYGKYDRRKKIIVCYTENQKIDCIFISCAEASKWRL